MPKTKITQNINKDAGLLDLPKVEPQSSQWETRFSNYTTSNIGDIVPIYSEVVMPGSKKKVTMGMLSHMMTPTRPIFNAQYTEFRAFFVPHRLSSDLLAGYKTRKSPWVKVFGEDNASANAQIVVPLAQQKLPNISSGFRSDLLQIYSDGSLLNSFGGILDALDIECPVNDDDYPVIDPQRYNYLNLASYELIYQKAYRNQNRESATESVLYRFLFDAYNRSTIGSDNLNIDHFHKAQREKDYFTGSSPFTQKGDAVTAPLSGSAQVKADLAPGQGPVSQYSSIGLQNTKAVSIAGSSTEFNAMYSSGGSSLTLGKVYADLSSATGVNIETLRLMIKTQELLEKDMMYGSDYASSLNAHFGTAPISLILDEPWEIKKVTITSQMQAIFQTSSTSGESTILGQIGANATTQASDIEIVPLTEFKEWGYLMICAVHKAQNAYDSRLYKSKYLFKKARFDHYTPELDDLGYQSIIGLEFNASVNGADTPVAFNEAFAEDRFVFNKCHGMFEPSRVNALDDWVLCCSNYDDIQSLYKQTEAELDRAVSVTSAVAPQFYDAFGFVEYNDKPMKLHSIPGMDGVI